MECWDLVNGDRNFDKRFALLLPHLHRLGSLALSADSQLGLNILSRPFHTLEAPILRKLVVNLDIGDSQNQAIETYDSKWYGVVEDESDEDEGGPLITSDSKEYQRFHRGLVLFREVPKLEILHLNNAHFHPDHLTIDKVSTLVLSRDAGYIPDLDIDDETMFGCLLGSLKRLLISRDVFGRVEGNDEIKLPQLQSLVILPPVREPFHDFWDDYRHRLNVPCYLRAPALTSLLIYLDEPDEKEDGHHVRERKWILDVIDGPGGPQFPCLERLALVCAAKGISNNEGSEPDPATIE
ncbi:hypothetical protein C8J56DRAFT_960260 [Mycena floridula]|nr:hypothetical protein C8J56DRAFT_960260 [Mycena floridula]